MSVQVQAAVVAAAVQAALVAAAVVVALVAAVAEINALNGGGGGAGSPKNRRFCKYFFHS